MSGEELKRSRRRSLMSSLRSTTPSSLLREANSGVQQRVDPAFITPRMSLPCEAGRVRERAACWRPYRRSILRSNWARLSLSAASSWWHSSCWCVGRTIHIRPLDGIL